jgi:prephenate dehydratase
MNTAPTSSVAMGYFGLPGSFSHEVALRAAPATTMQSFAQQADGFSGLQRGDFDRIVVPFENSIGGAVPETLDQLILMKDWERQFTVLEQWVYSVHLCLLSRSPLSKIRRIYSHFVPLQVVAGWLKRELPNAETIYVASTSAAAERAAADETAGAIGNAAAAEVYGLTLRAQNLSPARENLTRFLLVGRRNTASVSSASARTSSPHRAMVHLHLANHSGSLCDALLVFRRAKINLTQILSRPVRGRPGSHQFLLELDVPPPPFDPAPLWRRLEKVAASVHLLGVYPVRNIQSRPRSRSK